jgi:hypothetical protein
MLRRHSTAEKKLLEKWADTSPCEEFAYAGCNICSAPYLTQAKFLQGLNIRGGLDYCCGEMYFRTGMLDQLRQTAARLNRYVGRSLQADGYDDSLPLETKVEREPIPFDLMTRARLGRYWLKLIRPAVILKARYLERFGFVDPQPGLEQAQLRSDRQAWQTFEALKGRAVDGARLLGHARTGQRNLAGRRCTRLRSGKDPEGSKLSALVPSHTPTETEAILGRFLPGIPVRLRRAG